MTPPFKTHALLNHHAISYGFFGRKGGVSNGPYESLNVGQGSDDTSEAITENRKIVAKTLGTSASKLLSLSQIHSSNVMIVDASFLGRPPKADGLVTQTPGLAISALSADCGPVLFYEPSKQIVGACHAGWRGALSGVTTETIRAMESLGAIRENIRAVLGPCISQESYEVGHDFRDTFVAEDEIFDRFFMLGSNKKPHFDLKRFILAKLRNEGLTQIDAFLDCTYASPSEYFSYRYNTHHGLGDYGRNISAIMLKS
ncbi:peptidoglycan editing factor PgeF [Hellea balneolensis]|uniref:peptidoglycan editing factor PgeF n=1 Tax=Hellea balneolensis TaxID=287478 RepID=UPI0003F77BC3|nr:peptidoglycan editing factor PgeF [Hellea balneolensis]